MTSEKWQELVGRIKDAFTVLHEGREELDPVGTADFIEFQAPAGKLRLEFIQKPAQIGVRGVGSHRIGGQVHLEAEYSDEDIVQRLAVYRANAAGAWEEVHDPSVFPLAGS